MRIKSTKKKKLGESHRICLPSGQWSDDDPACDPVVCPVPDIPKHGSWNVGGFVPGSSIRFECHQGYTLVGSAVTTCLMDKQWSDDPPTCQQVTCPSVRDPDNGIVHVTLWSSASDQIATNSLQHIHFRWPHQSSMIRFDIHLLTWASILPSFPSVADRPSSTNVTPDISCSDRRWGPAPPTANGVK